MSKELEAMSLCEYRVNAMDVLDSYKEYIPASVWQDVYFNIITARRESDITRALRSCRDAL